MFGSTHPHLWGKEPIGIEETDEFGGKKNGGQLMDVCRSGKGWDDPRVNLFVGWPVIRCLLLLLLRKICLRIIMKKLANSGWLRKVEMEETAGGGFIPIPTRLRAWSSA